MTETIDFIMQWLAAPVAAFVWMLHVKAQRHEKDIAVLQSQNVSDNLRIDREMRDVKDALRAINSKLDNIEQALRDK